MTYTLRGYLNEGGASSFHEIGRCVPGIGVGDAYPEKFTVELLHDRMPYVAGSMTTAGKAEFEAARPAILMTGGGALSRAGLVSVWLAPGWRTNFIAPDGQRFEVRPYAWRFFQNRYGKDAVKTGRVAAKAFLKALPEEERDLRRRRDSEEWLVREMKRRVRGAAAAY